ncbi:MAG: hypothetical protein JW747_02910 [Candidatus Aminicenantes bacterium]|nr:hypothetical protein [Candidatus Aminicenantes bacterium]
MKKPSKGIVMGILFLGMTMGLASGYGAGVISVSSAAFKPNDHYMASLNWYAYANQAYFDSGYPNSGYMEAPVFLPNLATVTGFVAVVTDNGTGPDDEIHVSLRRQNIQTGMSEILASVYTSSSFALASRQTLTDTSISNAVVDNDTYTYSVLVRFYIPRSYLRLHGVKIQHWSVL